jgi:DNA-binding GntR family transcriptional regulator
MIERSNLRRQVSEELRARILDGRLPAGATIREPGLAVDLGVSRTPLREALLALEHEGLLTSDVGRGFSVAPLSAKEVLDLYPILANLHGLALGSNGLPGEETLALLSELNESIGANLDSPKRLFDLDRRWHSALLSNCTNLELLHLIEQYTTRSRRYDLAYWREYGDAHVSIAEHEQILDALRFGALDDAQRRLTVHWMSCVPRLEKWLSNKSDTERTR